MEERITKMTSEEAQVGMKKWADHYKAATPKAGFMVLSLCILLVSVAIQILKHVEEINTPEGKAEKE